MMLWDSSERVSETAILQKAKTNRIHLSPHAEFRSDESRPKICVRDSYVIGGRDYPVLFLLAQHPLWNFLGSYPHIRARQDFEGILREPVRQPKLGRLRD